MLTSDEMPFLGPGANSSIDANRGFLREHLGDHERGEFSEGPTMSHQAKKISHLEEELERQEELTKEANERASHWAKTADIFRAREKDLRENSSKILLENGKLRKQLAIIKSTFKGENNI